MRFRYRFVAVGVTSLALSILPGCGGPSGQGPSAVVEDPAIKAAQDLDKGEGLKKGESREVKTPQGTVIVFKNANDEVAYRKK